MVPRGTIIAALAVIELAIIGEGFVAIRGGSPAAGFARIAAEPTTAAPLEEGGAHRIFVAEGQPALTVDIGYADLTIITANAPVIDVSVRPSTAFGLLRATAPITTRDEDGTIRIATTGGTRWVIGDDRMVTVRVPPHTKVTVVKAGDILADGLRAPASLTSVGRGSVTVEDYNAPELQVAASNGHISLHGIDAERLDATSSNGRVDGTALRVRDGTVESDGRVTLEFAAGADSLVTAETNDGAVRLSGFPAAQSAPSETSGDADDDASARTVRLGAGSGRLNVHASEGNINLTRAT
jgi:hypothetical protein